MEDRDKAIEIMKAAMEKEKEMKENSKESMEQQIDAKTPKDTLNDALDLEEAIPEEQVTDCCGVDIAEETVLNEVLEGKHDKTNKSLFKHTKSKELAAKDTKIEELTDRLMRNMAEFDNFRKRSDKEKSQMYDMGVKSMIEKMLPIIDNFERGLGAISEKEKENAFVQGIELIYRQLISTLDDIGLKAIDAVGNQFDPNLHNAVMHGEDESLGENIISDEFQKGYMYRDMVVRYSMVKVVN